MNEQLHDQQKSELDAQHPELEVGRGGPRNMNFSHFVGHLYVGTIFNVSYLEKLLK